MTMDGQFQEGKIQVFHLWGKKKEQIGDPELIKTMLREIVVEIGMTPHGEPQIVKYPTPELGNTIFAFVGYQPLHESYIVYDNWIELDPPYANLIINSCKTYDTVNALLGIMRRIDLIYFKIEDPVYYTGRR